MLFTAFILVLIMFVIVFFFREIIMVSPEFFYGRCAIDIKNFHGELIKKIERWESGSIEYVPRICIESVQIASVPILAPVAGISEKEAPYLCIKWNKRAIDSKMKKIMGWFVNQDKCFSLSSKKIGIRFTNGKGYCELVKGEKNIIMLEFKEKDGKKMLYIDCKTVKEV